MSSKRSGCSCRKIFFIPADSNWKTPFVIPCRNNLNVASSFKSIVAILKLVLSSCFWISRNAMSKIFKFDNAKKSIFKRPSASTGPFGNWVTNRPSSPSCTGIVSTNGSADSTTPAACKDELRGSPSSLRAVS